MVEERNSRSSVSLRRRTDAIRDPDYYKTSKDCTIRVEDTLFMLSQSFLARDGSFFVDLFNLPIDQNRASNSSLVKLEEDIIVLYDSVLDFRALCWALSAMPSEIKAQSDHNADVPRLLSVARMAIKYNFVSLSTWAIDLIDHHSKSFLDTCSETHLEHIAFVADHAPNQPSLIEAVKKRWLERLEDGQLSVEHALDVAEGYDWTEFLGSIYYREVLRLCSVSGTLATLGVMPIMPTTLKTPHERRLLVGFFSLVMFWDRFSKKELPFTKFCESGPDHYSRCLPNYKQLWTELIASAMGGYKPVDVLGKLSCMRRNLTSLSTYKSIHVPCRQQIENELAEVYNGLKASMHLHFLGSNEEVSRRDESVIA